MKEQASRHDPSIAPPASGLVLALVLALLVTLAPLPAMAQDPPPDPNAIPADWWSQVRQQILASEYTVTWQEHTYLPDLPAA